ncbi:MAG: YceI family protein [Pseudomonadota bacterium]
MTDFASPKAFLALLGLSLASTEALAADWTPRPAESSIAFVGSQTGAEFKGGFERFDANISFDPADLAASSVTATIDMASFTIEGKDRREALPGADWFSLKTFPEAQFKTTAIRAAEAGAPTPYIADAELTIRDASQAVSLPFSVEIEGDVARMSGELTLDRSAFGVGQGQWESDQWVAHEVRVSVTIVADRAASE